MTILGYIDSTSVAVTTLSETVVDIQPTNTLTVSPDDGEYKTISDAIDGIALLDEAPSETNKLVILVSNGIYTENNPLVIPSYVTLMGSGIHTTIIKPLNITADLIQLETQSNIAYLTVEGESADQGVGIRCDGANIATVDDIVLRQFQTCWVIENSAQILGRRNLVFGGATKTTGTGISVLSGGTYISSGQDFGGQLGNLITTGILVSGANSTVKIINGNFQYCSTAIIVNSGGEIDYSNGTIFDCVEGLDVTGASTIAHIRGINFDDNTHNMIINDNLAEVLITHCELDEQKITLPSNFTSDMVFADTNSNALHSYKILSELNVGSFDKPSASSFGGGGESTRTMVVLRNDNAEVGTWTDITTEVTSQSSSTVDMFDGLTANNAVYVGVDQPFPGLTINLTQIIDYGTGDIQTEYWNGTAWVDFSSMVSRVTSPYTPLGNMALLHTGETNYRFGIGTRTSDWTTKTLNSETKYWVRIIISALIDQMPILEQVKHHANKTKINSDGFMEFFGTARPIRKIVFDPNIAKPAQNSPLNQDTYVITSLGIGRTENRFVTGVRDSTGFSLTMPTDIDTSWPLSLRLTWFPIGTPVVGVTDEIRWEIIITKSSVGDSIGTSSGTAPASNGYEATYTSTPTILSASANQQQVTEIDMDVSWFVSDREDSDPLGKYGDQIWVELSRVGSNAADTWTGDIALNAITPVYHAWRLGSY